MRQFQSYPFAFFALLVASLLTAPRGVPAQTAAASAATAATPKRTHRFIERHVASADEFASPISSRGRAGRS